MNEEENIKTITVENTLAKRMYEAEELNHFYQVSELYKSVWIYHNDTLVKGKVIGINKKEKKVRVRQWELYSNDEKKFDLWLFHREVWKYKSEAIIQTKSKEVREREERLFNELFKEEK